MVSSVQKRAFLEKYYIFGLTSMLSDYTLKIISTQHVHFLKFRYWLDYNSYLEKYCSQQSETWLKNTRFLLNKYAKWLHPEKIIST